MGATLDPDASTKSWAMWLGATVATFAALEAHAVSSRRIPTLSHCLRVWLGIQPAKRHRHIAAVTFAGFFSWLVLHVVAGLGPNLKDHRAPQALERSDPEIFDDSIEYERRR